MNRKGSDTCDSNIFFRMKWNYLEFLQDVSHFKSLFKLYFLKIFKVYIINVMYAYCILRVGIIFFGLGFNFFDLDVLENLYFYIVFCHIAN